MLKRFATVAMSVACSLAVFHSGGIAHAGTLSISPLRTEITLNAGETTGGELEIRNGGEKPGSITLSREAFQVSDGNYDYSFTEDSEITSWVTFDSDDFVLQPGESRQISYRLAVPQNAQPGGKYLALIASLQAENQPSRDGITPVQRAASLLYITVPGDITRTGALKTVSAPFLSFTRPINWSYSVANQGTVHFRSRSSVRLRTLWGRTLSEETSDPLILPKTVRTITGKNTIGILPGVYQLDFTIGLGDKPVAVVKKWILYLPPFSTLAICVVIASLGYFFGKKISRKN